MSNRYINKRKVINLETSDSEEGQRESEYEDSECDCDDSDTCTSETESASESASEFESDSEESQVLVAPQVPVPVRASSSSAQAPPVVAPPATEAVRNTPRNKAIAATQTILDGNATEVPKELMHIACIITDIACENSNIGSMFFESVCKKYGLASQDGEMARILQTVVHGNSADPKKIRAHHVERLQLFDARVSKFAPHRFAKRTKFEIEAEKVPFEVMRALYIKRLMEEEEK